MRIDYRGFVPLAIVLLVVGIYFLGARDLVGQATDAVVGACEHGKFYFSDADDDGIYDDAQICNCVGNSCVKGGCEGGACHLTRQIVVDPQGGKISINGVDHSAQIVLDPAPVIGTLLAITVQPQEQTITPGTELFFLGWADGTPAATTSRNVVVTKDETYAARWDTKHRLTVQVSDPLAGTAVDQSGASVVGQHFYSDGTPLILTAQPSNGFAFMGWLGTGVNCPGVGTCSITLNTPTTLSALFSRVYSVSVTKSGDGTGVIKSSLHGSGGQLIDCGTVCSENYPDKTIVILTATPLSGSVFAGWGGDCSGASHTCQVTIDRARSATATFTRLSYTLSVARRGTGSGNVASEESVKTIDCGDDCSEGYLFGVRKTLTATPNANSVFAGWSGPCGGTSTCTVSMIEARSVSATFTPQNAPAETGSHALDIVRAGTGSGTITVPPGITCVNAACREFFGAGTFVTLTAVPLAGSVFTGWSEPSCGTSITCTLLISAPKSVTASFAVSPLKLSIVDGAGAVFATLLGGSQRSDCVFTHDQASNIFECVVPAVALVNLPRSPALSFIKAETKDVVVGGSVLSTAGDWTLQSLFIETTSGVHERSDCSGIVCSKDFGHPGGDIRIIVRAVPRSAQLTVSTSGTGSVVSSPFGIACGTDCSQVYDRGARVILTATPGINSVFVGWSGDACAGSQNPACTVEVTVAKSVSAQFVEGYRLNLLFSGTGLGTVTSTSTPSQTSQFLCTSQCSIAYPTGTSVTLVATSDAGSRFTGWGNACTGTGQCTVLLDGPKQVSVTFVPRFLLTLTVAGSGTVTSDPAGEINCGNGNTLCSKEYNEGQRVRLTANPPSTSVFVGWSGSSGYPCLQTEPGLTCTFDMRTSLSVTAQFAPAFPLTVTGSSSGIVTSAPSGILCGEGGPCTKSYPSGTRVTLTAAPKTNFGRVFTGWSGDACAGSLDLTCTVDMTAEKHVTAGFASGRTITVNPTAGHVTSQPSGITCGGGSHACASVFPEGVRITLTGTGVDGSVFKGFGFCDEAGDVILDNTCSFTVSRDRTIIGSFHWFTANYQLISFENSDVSIGIGPALTRVLDVNPDPTDSSSDPIVSCGREASYDECIVASTAVTSNVVTPADQTHLVRVTLKNPSSGKKIVALRMEGITRSGAAVSPPVFICPAGPNTNFCESSFTFRSDFQGVRIVWVTDPR